MSSVFDAVAYGYGNTGSLTFAHVMGSAPHGLLLVEVTNLGPYAPTVAYGGNAMTLIDSRTAGVPYSWTFILVNPPVGSNNVVVTCTSSYVEAQSVSYTGVNTNNPIGNLAHAVANTVNVASQSDHLVVDFLSVFNNPGSPVLPTAGAGQTQRASNKYYKNPECQGVGTSEKVGSGTTTMAWTTTGWGNAYIVAFELLPYIEPRGRAFDDFIDVYDPDFQIRDAQGRIVPPYAIRSDAWGMLLGISMPSSIVVANYAQDVTGSYYYREKVEYDDISGQARITCNRCDLDKVALARAAGQSGG